MVQINILLAPLLCWTLAIQLVSAGKFTRLSNPFTSLNEIGCMEDCVTAFVPGTMICTTEACQGDCQAFTNAYWAKINTCIQSSCQVTTATAKVYAAEAKVAVIGFCKLKEYVFLPRTGAGQLAKRDEEAVSRRHARDLKTTQ